ncbi:hypothetical protein WJX74_003337 [Apatococcus lobatus]|uniref:SBP-type domain-containing protein n=1 Tax=Apatococcus lobatus TaxID=904363 RepID=A0AAW1SB40_9CHLO
MTLQLPKLALEELVAAGDELTWSLDDWDWDPIAMLANPKQGVTVPRQTACSSQKVAAGPAKAGTKAAALSSCHMPQPQNGAELQASRALVGTSTGCQALCTSDFADLDALLCRPTPSSQSPTNASARKAPASEGSAAAPEDEMRLASSSSGSLVEQPASAAAAPVSTCQADGCQADLSRLSVYHQRCRICEEHLKADDFMRCGRPKRFCQQCGRSHELTAFDPKRRSCRDQLAKHAARRRKRSASKSVQHKVIKLEPADGPSAGTPPASEAPALPLEQAATSCQLPIALEVTSNADEVEPVVVDGSTTATASSDIPRSQPEALPCQFMRTLLSAQQPGGSCSGWTSLMAEACSINAQQPVIQPGLLRGEAGQDLEQLLQQQQAASDPRNPGARPGAAPDNPDVPSSWATGDSQPEHQPQQLGYAQQHRHLQPQPQQGVQIPGQPFHEPAEDPQELWQQYQGQQRLASQPLPASSFDLAMSLLGPVASSSTQQLPLPQQQGWAMGPAAGSTPLTYHPHHFVSRLSLKLFSCTPADLPDDLRAQLTGWLKSAPAGAEGYMRPGCVHLTLDALVDSADSGSIESLVQHLVCGNTKASPADGLTSPQSSSPASQLFTAKSWMVQLQEEVALVHQGRIVKRWSVGEDTLPQAAASGFPVICRLLPSAMVAAKLQFPSVVELQGFNIGCGSLTVLCRANGRYLPVKLVEGQTSCCRNLSQHTDFSMQVLSVQLPANLPSGIVYIEVQKGAYLSAAAPLLIADKALAASEASELLAAAADGQSHAGLITDFGVVASALSLQLASTSPPSGLQRDQPGRLSSGICSKCVEGPAPAPSMAASVSDAVIRATARKLLQVACRRGAARLIQYLLPIAAGAAAAGKQQLLSGRSCNELELPSPASDRRADLTAPDATGMTLLHSAVQSGCAVAVDALLDGGCRLGIHWQGDAKGPAGLTPLHLAAVLQDHGACARSLMKAGEPGGNNHTTKPNKGQCSKTLPAEALSAGSMTTALSIDLRVFRPQLSRAQKQVSAPAAPSHGVDHEAFVDNWHGYDSDMADLCSSDGDVPEQEEEDQDHGAEYEIAECHRQGWRILDVLNEAMPDLSQDLLSADERSVIMCLPLGSLSRSQKAALGLQQGLLLEYRLVFRSQTMGAGEIPLGEVTCRLREPSADPDQLDKLTISTVQASRWMLAGGLQASRQAQLFPGRRVIWQLATMLDKALHDDWPIIATGKFKQAVAWVRTLHSFMKERIINLGNYCLICGKLQEIRGLKPVPCGTPLCCHRHDELGFGADLHEVVDSPGVADLLLTLAASASCDTTHRHSLFVGAPSDFISRLRGLSQHDASASPAVARMLALQPDPTAATGQQADLLPWQTAVNGSIDFDKLNTVFAELPSVEAMSQAEDLEGFLQNGTHGRSAYRLVRWILSTNRGYLVELPSEHRLDQMRGQQFYLMTNSPEREAAFQKLKARNGSIWKFHGSSFHNWHSILRTNLRNVSGTQLMRVGQALGKGIYLASNSATSRHYCGHGVTQCYSQSAMGMQGAHMALGLCEVAMRDTGADAIAVPDEDAVALRYLFIYNNTEFPTVTAAELKMEGRVPPV